MWNFHRLYVSIFGLFMFGILQGMCGVSDETVKVLKVGDSLELPVQYPMKSVLSVRWLFNGSRFAQYQNQSYKFQQSQFSGRLKMEQDRVVITVKNLQIQDSGIFTVTLFSTDRGQQPTQRTEVSIQSPITAVQTKKSQAWSVSSNICEVDVMCAAIGAKSLSYLWSGYKTASGAHLQFSLSPEEGTVTLNCTAANNVSSRSATETLSCVGMPNYVWIAVGGGAALVLLISCLIVAITYWCRTRKSKSDPEETNTVYESVQPGSSGQKDKRSDSVANGSTLYETVSDLRVNQEMTIYAKVTLPKHTEVSATSSSPYHQVL